MSYRGTSHATSISKADCVLDLAFPDGSHPWAPKGFPTFSSYVQTTLNRVICGATPLNKEEYQRLRSTHWLNRACVLSMHTKHPRVFVRHRATRSSRDTITGICQWLRASLTSGVSHELVKAEVITRPVWENVAWVGIGPSTPINSH